MSTDGISVVKCPLLITYEFEKAFVSINPGNQVPISLLSMEAIANYFWYQYFCQPRFFAASKKKQAVVNLTQLGTY